MVVGIKDTVKLFGVSIVACCAVFVCSLFVNYNIDLTAVEDEIVIQSSQAFYDAQISTARITVALTGTCLLLTSVIMLFFYIKNFIDSHASQLGVLKALGYSQFEISKHFWVFGLTVLIGCGVGYGASCIYMPEFYCLQNVDGYLPDISVEFHLLVLVSMVVLPAVAFAALAVIYGGAKLNTSPLLLIRGERKVKAKNKIGSEKEGPFLKGLATATLKRKKTLVFFVAFSGFAFASMVQMAVSMKELASDAFAYMILGICLILTSVILLLSLSSVVKENSKTIAMMRVYGYEYNECTKAILGAYRPWAYLGFVIGTVYQFVILKLMVQVVFAGLETTPEYNFNVKSFLVTLAVFAVAYEIVMKYYSQKIKRLTVKSVMTENE